MAQKLTYVRAQSRRKKPGPTARARAKRMRADAKVATAVRAACVERDGYCVLMRALWGDIVTVGVRFDCSGFSQWCHMHDRRRSKTRGQAPEIRHDTAHTFMGCQRHHDQYDNKAKPRLFIAALTRKGADGPLKFRSGRT